MGNFWSFLASFGWMLVVVYLIGWRFKEPVEFLLRNLKKVGWGGAEVRDPAPSQDAASGPPKDAAKVALKESVLKPDALHAPVVENIEKELEKLGLTQTEDQLARLKIALAGMMINLANSSAYIMIFGSQIELLKRLNQAGRLQLDAVKPIFDAAIAKYPEMHQGRNLEQWIAFLLHYGLIERAGDEVSITPLGQAFLMFIIQNRYSEIKAG